MLQIPPGDPELGAARSLMYLVSSEWLRYSGGHEVSQDLGATVPGNATDQEAFWGRECAGLSSRRETRELRAGCWATPRVRPGIAAFSGCSVGRV